MELLNSLEKSISCQSARELWSEHWPDRRYLIFEYFLDFWGKINIHSADLDCKMKLPHVKRPESKQNISWVAHTCLARPSFRKGKLEHNNLTPWRHSHLVRSPHQVSMSHLTPSFYFSLALNKLTIVRFKEPTETSKQPIRTRYLGHVTGYQPIRDLDLVGSCSQNITLPLNESDWTEVTKNVKIDWDLEQDPLQIKTNFGTTEGRHLRMKATIGNMIIDLSSPMKFALSYCTGGWTTDSRIIVGVPKKENPNIFTIRKDSENLTVHCNGDQIVELKFAASYLPNYYCNADIAKVRHVLACPQCRGNCVTNGKHCKTRPNCRREVTVPPTTTVFHPNTSWAAYVTYKNPSSSLYISYTFGDGELDIEITETSKQPIRTRYLGHVTSYQPIRDQYLVGIGIVIYVCLTNYSPENQLKLPQSQLAWDQELGLVQTET
eukprot:sb/3464839/